MEAGKRVQPDTDADVTFLIPVPMLYCTYKTGVSFIVIEIKVT